MMIDLTILLFAALGLGITCLAVWNIFLSSRIRNLTRGNDNMSLEDVLNTQSQNIDELTQWCEKLHRVNQDRDRQFTSSVKGIGFKRYNPYDESGPQQSFALALLSTPNEGIILSSISSRDKMRIFAKRIHDGASDQELNHEEQHVLDSAQKSIKQLTRR
jgi:hypothetical protein